MAEMLLINPRKRTARKTRRANPVGARKARRVRRNPAAAVARRVRRRNPVAAVGRRTRRRRNPVAAVARRMRRRSNPSARLTSVNTYMTAIKSALVGGAGSVAVDALMGYVGPMLPSALIGTPGKLSAYDATKAVITVAAGQLLNKPTRGLSVKMAQGALTVQAANIIKGFLPASVTMGNVGRMGYATPGNVVTGTNRVGPIQRVGAYTRPGSTPLLSQYVPGASPLLNGSRRSASSREGVAYR